MLINDFFLPSVPHTGLHSCVQNVGQSSLEASSFSASRASMIGSLSPSSSTTVGYRNRKIVLQKIRETTQYIRRQFKKIRQKCKITFFTDFFSKYLNLAFEVVLITACLSCSFYKDFETHMIVTRTLM